MQPQKSHVWRQRLRWFNVATAVAAAVVSYGWRRTHENRADVAAMDVIIANLQLRDRHCGISHALGTLDSKEYVARTDAIRGAAREWEDRRGRYATNR